MTNLTLPPTSSKVSGKKNRQGLAFLLLVILLTLWAVYQVIAWMADEKQLPISEIAVQGDLYYISSTEVRDAVIELGPLQSFMFQDVDSIQRAVSALPWVNHVSVRKQWPNTIKVNITEHSPIAIWNNDQLLDGTGIVFNADPTQIKDKKLVSLQGPKGSEQDVLTAWSELGNILRQTGLDIAELALNERRSWRIATTNGIRIELGRESRIERLKRFVSLFNEIKATRRAIDYVDLRYDTGAAIGWKPTIKSNQP